jgi:uncharacterized lipoprotein YddW (UPF0748 family)
MSRANASSLVLLFLTAALSAAGCSGTGPVVEPTPVTPVTVEESDAGLDSPDAGTPGSGDDTAVEPSGADSGEEPGTATDGGSAPRPEETGKVEVPVEVRAVWVTRWDFKSAEDIRQIIQTVADAGFNLVYFQVRGVADAYYKSTLEPWAAPLAGKLGRDPGWDPLQVAIDAAHKHGIELHAWINVSTAWKGKAPPGRSKPRHILRTHPYWRVAQKGGPPMPYNDGYVFVNPANPDFQKHLRAVVAELVSFYSLDGLHLDYARYPSADVSYDKPCNRLFWKAKKKDKSLTRAAWQRGELTRLVKALKDDTRKVKPDLTVSAAVTGIYKDRWKWGEVTHGFFDFHQDSHRWATEKAVDVLIPMIYWKPTRPAGRRTDFLTLVKDFAALSDRVQLLIGINVNAGNFAVLADSIRIAREQGCHGVALFSYALLKQKKWFGKLKEGVFKEPALARPPPMVAIKDSPRSR